MVKGALPTISPIQTCGSLTFPKGVALGNTTLGSNRATSTFFGRVRIPSPLTIPHVVVLTTILLRIEMSQTTTSDTVTSILLVLPTSPRRSA